MKRIALLAAVAAFAATRPPDIPFDKITLDLGANESCAVMDVNGDGKLDIVSGENWYEAPKWTKHHFRDLPYSNFYIDNFSDLPLDVNGDGSMDIVGCSWFAKRLVWFENPGKKGGAWKEHPVETGFNIEFAFLVDIGKKGEKRDVLPQFGNKEAPLAWYESVGGTTAPIFLRRRGGSKRRPICARASGSGIRIGIWARRGSSMSST